MIERTPRHLALLGSEDAAREHPELFEGADKGRRENRVSCGRCLTGTWLELSPTDIIVETVASLWLVHYSECCEVRSTYAAVIPYIELRISCESMTTERAGQSVTTSLFQQKKYGIPAKSYPNHTK